MESGFIQLKTFPRKLLRIFFLCWVCKWRSNEGIIGISHESDQPAGRHGEGISLRMSHGERSLCAAKGQRLECASDRCAYTRREQTGLWLARSANGNRGES